MPKDADGSSAYKGPYKGTGQDLFDKAITCEGQTLTLHFSTPWADFNSADGLARGVLAVPQGQGQG